MNHNSEIQVVYSKVHGSSCLNVFYLINRMKYCDAISKLYFEHLNMPKNVLGISSNNSDYKIDTSLFVQKLYLTTNFIDSKIEDNIDMKIQFTINNLKVPIGIGEPAPNKNVDNTINTDFDLNDIKLKTEKIC